jgi:endonuclease/exonuclease/phosphatase (EEP) superfamily protein YafD
MPGRGHEASDRGGAILSTLPLSEPAAIELPGARQRRVAVHARIVFHSARGEMPVSIGALHLDVLGSPHTLWFFGAASSRTHQARSLIAGLPTGPMMLGADLNNWLGPDEQALRELRRSFPSTPSTSGASTFRGGLVLDYLFFRLPEGWLARVTRAPERYGSDHYPLIGWIEQPASTR